MLRPARLLSILALAALVPALASCGDDEGGGPSTIAGSSAPAQPVQLTGRATTIELDPLTVGTLADNGVTATPVPPARAVGEGMRFRFPIVGGEVRPDTLAGRVEHDGGIAFVHDERRRVVLRDFVIDSAGGQLTADAGAGRLPFLNLDLPAGKRLGAGGTVALADIPATLTVAGAHALNEALRISVLLPRVPFAAATVRAVG